MPDIDSSPGDVTGIRGEDGKLLPLSVNKRSRGCEFDSFPVKRRRGENGNALALLPPVSPNRGRNSPPLLESPGKLQNKLTYFTSDGAVTLAKLMPFSTGVETPGNHTTRRVRTARVIPRAVAFRTLAVTDPVFQGALLRLLHRRGGRACPEAVEWRWKGDQPSLFDHWPRSCHPAVMDLLAAVSAGEERVVKSENGLDKKLKGSALVEASWHSPSLRRETWRSSAQRMPPPRTLIETTPTRAVMCSTGTATPVSAGSVLRREGATPRTANRVRFQTHDMSVIDTPDPSRGGSEEGMMTALNGLQGILAAARKVCNSSWGSSDGPTIPKRAGKNADGWSGVKGGEGRRLSNGEETEYFDRFESVVESSVVESDDVKAEQSVESTDLAKDLLPSEEATAEIKVRRIKGKAIMEDMEDVIVILGEMAAADAGPVELELVGGWGMEHSKAAAFYHREFSLLCGRAPENSGGADANLGASYLRKRFLDVLSCLIRFNLKVLLNVCTCDDSPPVLEIEAEEDREEEENCSPLVPCRNGVSKAHSPWYEGGSIGCGCMTVVEGTGTCEFNCEDPAALLTLALQRIHPFQSLAARIATAVASSAPLSPGLSPSSSHGSGPESPLDSTVESNPEVNSSSNMEEQLWCLLHDHVAECRASAAPSTSSVEKAVGYPTTASVTSPSSSSEMEDIVSLTVEDVSDLLEYTAALRFLAQMFSESVVSAGVARGHWAAAERLASQVREIDTLGRRYGKAHSNCSSKLAADVWAGETDVLCLGWLGDMRAFTESVAVQSQALPYLETMLTGEMHRALQRGQGRAQRLKSRLQRGECMSPGAGGCRTALAVMAFPEVKPYCFGYTI
ncbi:unnamed protein product [Choristocarpus tenellus]